MKPFLILILVALLSVSAYSAPEEAPSVPDIVSKGFDAYGEKGLTLAIDVWFKDSPFGNDLKVRVQMIDGLTGIEKVYGKYLGWELVHRTDFTASTCRIYAVSKYEKGPLWCYFDCYKVKDAWTIPTFNFNTKATEILTPALLSK